MKDTFWVGNIEKKTNGSKFFRKVIYTAPQMQLVTMCLEPGQEIGTEVHRKGDQFIRVESGSGKLVLQGKTHRVSPGFATVIPRQIVHNLINTSNQHNLHAYIIYTPPEHPHDTKTMHNH